MAHCLAVGMWKTVFMCSTYSNAVKNPLVHCRQLNRPMWFRTICVRGSDPNPSAALHLGQEGIGKCFAFRWSSSSAYSAISSSQSGQIQRNVSRCDSSVCVRNSDAALKSSGQCLHLNRTVSWMVQMCRKMFGRFNSFKQTGQCDYREERKVEINEIKIRERKESDAPSSIPGYVPLDDPGTHQCPWTFPCTLDKCTGNCCLGTFHRPLLPAPPQCPPPCPSPTRERLRDCPCGDFAGDIFWANFLEGESIAQIIMIKMRYWELISSYL